MSVELDIMHVVQGWFSSPGGKEFIIFCARWIIFLLGFGAIALWRFGRIQRHAMVEIIWSTLLAALLAFGLELVLRRARPFAIDPSLLVLVPRPHTFSLPSAHASIAYAMAFGLLGWNVQWGAIAVILADLVALGRVAAGVHYPTDVFGGLMVGVFSFMIVRLGHHWVRSDQPIKKS